MRLWMIGVVSGYIVVSLLPILLPGWFILAAFSLAVVCTFQYASVACLYWGLLFGVAAGTLHGHTLLEHRVSSQCEAIPLTVEGEINSLPRRSPTRDGGSRQRFEFRPDSIEPSRCEGPRRLLLSYYGDLSLHPGERWRFAVKLKKPWGLANPGSFNMQSWFAQSGIDATGNVREKQAVLLGNSPKSRFNYHLVRQSISEHIDQLAFNEDIRGILRALTVADKSGIDGQLWKLLQFYGINHLLVISGLHISIAAGAGYFFAAVLVRLLSPFRAFYVVGLLPVVMALVFAFFYAALAGFAMATVRALCMLACFAIASVFSRGSLSASNLLIAAVVILFINPLAAIGSGFWLSFCAVACLLWLGAWRTNQRLPLRLLHTHVYMALAMVPLGAWWFGGVSQVAVLANLALVPLIGLFVVPVTLLAVAAYLAGLSLEGHLWALASWPLEQLLPQALSIAEHQSEFLYVYLSPGWGEILLAVVALALLVIPLSPGVRLLVALLALPIFLPGGNKMADLQIKAKLTVLDVGQGTALVLQSGENTLLYDTGGGDPEGSNMASMVILPFLRAQGIEKIHTLVISHLDNDHSAGTRTLMASMPTEQLIVGGDEQVFPEGRECRAGQAWRWPSGVRFQVLSPELRDELGSNNSSCVLQVYVGGLRLLLPGDIDSVREKELLRYWREGLRSDVLLVAHHGSLSSSSYTWLKIVQPEYAVFSSGYLNQFGHPHATIRGRYSGMGSSAFSTAADGAVEINIYNDGRISAIGWRAGLHPYWL